MTIVLFYSTIEKMQYSTVGLFIKKKRNKLKKKQSNFAIACGIEPASLCRFEKGESDIYFQNFVKIAYGFGLTPSQLLHEYEKYLQL